MKYIQKEIIDIKDDYFNNTLILKILKYLDISVEQYLELENSSIELELLDPLFKNIANKILKYKNDKVLLVGDYDCDGICSTTIMFDGLKKLGFNVGYYIPNRIKEGYGINKNIVDLAKHKDYKLIITLDNGVKAGKVLQYANDLDIDTIIVDHHEYNNELKDIIHPKLLKPYYQNMCTAGLSYFLIKSLNIENDYYLTLAGIATLADVMILSNANRYLVKESIKNINTNNYDSLNILSNINKYDEETINYEIIPKINATGRLCDLANPNNTVKYLLLEDNKQIINVAHQINKVNNYRKELSNSYYQKIVDTNILDKNFNCVFIKDLHEGIIGLLASRISSEFNTNIIVFTNNEDNLKGSIRTTNIDLTRFFNDYKDIVAFGGHKHAGGITIKKEYYENFKDYLDLNSKELEDTTKSYLLLDESDLTLNNYLGLNRFRPFGQGFKMPLFGLKIKIDNYTIMKDKHLKIVVNNELDIIIFNYKKYDILNREVILLADLRINEFRGNKKISFIVQDCI